MNKTHDVCNLKIYVGQFFMWAKIDKRMTWIGNFRIREEKKIRRRILKRFLCKKLDSIRHKESVHYKSNNL